MAGEKRKRTPTTPSTGSCLNDCWLRALQPVTGPEVLSPSPAETVVHHRLKSLKDVGSQLFTPVLPWQTRVLLLRPGKVADPLRADLLTADIIKSPGLALTDQKIAVPYVALSYVWGTHNYDWLLICNGLNIGITENLWAALKHVRSETDAVHIWADAICLNQFDPAEKAMQAKNKWDIYSKAEKVVCWLGQEETSTGLVINFIHALLSFEKSYSKNKDVRDHSKECISNAKLAVSSWSDFLSIPWFSRTWVRQETCAAQDLTLLCGSRELNSAAFRKLTSIPIIWRDLIPVQLERELGPTFPSSVPDTVQQHCYWNVFFDRREAWESETFADTWIKLLVGDSAFGTGDSRDRVHAYIGMAEHIHYQTRVSPDSKHLLPKNLQIRYDISPRETYLNLTRSLMEDCQSFAPLQVLQSRQYQLNKTPTWVTDWSHQEPRVFVSYSTSYWSRKIRREFETKPLKPTTLVSNQGGASRYVSFDRFEAEGFRIGEVVPDSMGSNYTGPVSATQGLKLLDSRYEFFASWGLGGLDGSISGDSRADVLKDYIVVQVKVQGPATDGSSDRMLPALVANSVKPEDEIVGFRGGSVAMVLRKRSMNSFEHVFLGPALLLNMFLLEGAGDFKAQTYHVY